MTEPKRHDWPKIIAELEAVGVTVYKIALIMTTTGLVTQYNQVKRWAGGSEPRDRQARMLLEIHAENVPRETLQT